MIKVILKVNGEEFTAEGETFLDAIKEVNPNKESLYVFKTKGTLTLIKDGKDITQTLFPLQFRRIFSKFASPSVLKILSTRLENGLFAGFKEKSPLELL